MFLLGKREGTFLYATFCLALSAIILSPLNLGTYYYSRVGGVKVVVSLLFVGAVSYALEAPRRQYETLVLVKNALLHEEKKALELARSEISTMSNLLPICSYCKKTRDDHGYWQQVEAYVRDHSEVEFSHGICPDCYAQLEADLSDC
jgi:hypothetical protein